MMTHAEHLLQLIGQSPSCFHVVRNLETRLQAEGYQALSGLAEKGKAVVMVSSELPEILGVCDRVIVFCEGRIAAELVNDGLREQDVIHYAFAT